MRTAHWTMCEHPRELEPQATSRVEREAICSREGSATHAIGRGKERS